MSGPRLDRAIRSFVREHGGRPPDQLDRTPVVVERGVVLRAIYLLSRGAASPAVPQALRASLVGAGMALLNASKAADARRPAAKVTP